MMDSSLLRIGNAEFLDALYLAYRRDPKSVDPRWGEFFADIDDDSAPLPERRRAISPDSRRNRCPSSRSSR